MTPRQYTYAEKKFGIYILGAGFSVAAGLPLAFELWQEVRRRAEAQEWSARHFQSDLNYYIRFRKECDGIELSPDEVDFEEFLAFLDVEFHLGLLGSDTWSSDGNETQVIIKMLIGQILTERMPPNDCIPALYLKFAEKLKPGDHVLTFNYDIILERALDAMGVPYRLFPYRYKTIHKDGSGAIDSSREEVVIYKLHGSLDWFDRRKYREGEEYYQEKGYNDQKPHDRIFNPSDDLRTVPLKDGLQAPNDPLAEVHRVIDIEALYKHPPFLLSTPLLIPPSTAKILHSKQFYNFWHGMGQAGGTNFRMAIIGFSMAPHDDYVRQVVYTMIKNYQNIEWGEEQFEKKKEPVLLIDLCQSDSQKAAYRKRFAFVDESKAQFYFDGFDERALENF